MKTCSIVALVASVAATAHGFVHNVVEYQQAMQNPSQSFRKSDPLIVGGTETSRDAYLFTAGLRRTKEGRSFCAGSLISPTFVLTAAHCVGSGWWNPGPQWVSLASHFLEGTQDGEYIKVARIIRHPQYNKPISMSNDFALLELETPASQDIPLISLASATGDDEIVGESSTTCGWGTTTQGGSQSSVKLEVSVPIVSNEQCHRQVGGIDGSMICAGVPQGGKDACQGDSGGPLFTFNSQAEPILVGVVSWGKGCARAGLPGVYSRVSTVHDFVSEYVN